MRLLYSLVALLSFSLSTQAQLCTLDIETSMSFDTCGMAMNVTVLDSSNAPFTYTWKKWDSNSLNGTIVKDTTFSNPYDSLNNASLGTYSVSITDANGCFAYAVFSPIEVTNIGCSTDSVYIKYLPDTTIGFGYALADIHGYPMTKYDSILIDTFAQSTFSIQIPHSNFGTYGTFDLILDNREHCSSCIIPGGDTVYIIFGDLDTLITVTPDNYDSCRISSFIFSPPSSGDSSFLDKNNWIINKADTAICQSGNVQGGFSILSKKIDANNFIYSWSTGQSGQGLYSITGLSAGSYDVSITHVNQNVSCGSVVYPFTITSVTGTIGVNLSIETGAFCTLGDDTIKTTVTGGQTLYSYLWSNNKTTPSITATQGTYTVTVTDSIGCTALSSIYVNDETLSISIASLSPAVCDSGGAVTLSTNAPSNLVSYLWADGNVNNSRTDLTAGLHTVVVTHDSGCVDSITIYIPNTGLDFQIDSITHDCPNNGSGAVSLTSNYVGTVNYEWKYAGINGDVIQTGTASSMSGLADSSYVVTATVGGCSITKSFRVYKGPNVTIREEQAISCQSDGKLIAIANSEDATISSYTWSVGASPLNVVGNTIHDATAGNYEVVVTDANGCTASGIHTLLTYPEFSVSISSTVSDSCAATIDIFGGSPNYSVQWNRATTVDSMIHLDSIIGIVPYTTQITTNTSITQSKLPIGYYLIIVTDANGCKDSIDAFIDGERNTILDLEMYFRWEGEYTEECIGCISNQLPNETQVQAQTIADNMLRQVQDATQTLGDSMQQHSCDLVDLAEIDETTLEYNLDYHHYTLYYHNRRGELVRTVPPAGVDLLDTTEIAALEIYREDGTGTPPTWYPNHKMVTTYHYDAQGRMVASTSPDAGGMAYLYDSEGLLRFSQDARQAAFDTARYTYVLYDSLKRVIETGEAALPFGNSFDSYLANYQNDYNFPADQAIKKEWVKSYYSIPHMRNRSTTPYYVDSSAIGLENGSSWENAYTDLQDVLAFASAGDQIWVAKGTYYPTNTTTRNISFNVPSGVQLLGGFNGTESAKEERNWATNLTILSGDIGTTNDSSDNSYHVVTTNYVNSSTLLDGFIIQDGNADSLFSTNNSIGGGLLNNSVNGGTSNPSIQNCIFRRNRANTRGGAIENIANFGGTTSPTIVGCLFYDNSATTGNGAAIANAAYSSGGTNNGINNMKITNCTFADNIGSSIFNTVSGVDILVENSIVWDSIPFSGTGQATVHNCRFKVTGIPSGVSAAYGLYSYSEAKDPLFVNPSIGNYHLQDTSPAINEGNHLLLPKNFLYNKDLSQNNRIALGEVDLGAFEYNGNGTKIIYVDSSASGSNDGTSWSNAYTDLQTALDSVIKGNQIWVAQGTYYPTSGTDRTLSFEIPSGVQLFGGFNGTELLKEGRNWAENITILSGDIGTVSDSSDNSFNVIYLKNVINSTVLDGFIVQYGNADSTFPYDRGAGLHNSGNNSGFSRPIIQNCIFRWNRASIMGGAIVNNANYNGENWMVLTGCLFYENTCDDGASLAISTYSNGSDRSIITNCTFVDNEGTSIHNRHGNAKINIINSILWDSIPLYNYGTETTLSYSLIKADNLPSGTINAGNNILNEDPQFTDVLNNNYNIAVHSAIVDKGLSNIYPNIETTKDIGGNDRLRGYNIDMGAFEHVCEEQLVNYGKAVSDSMTYHDIAHQTQRYLRNRVSYTESWNGGDTCLVSTSTYSYDPHGNVEWLRNYIPGLGDNYLAMDYDLISGNVQKVKYNEYAADAFYHKYEYDEQNRIVEVLTSKDDVLWDRDAAYSYYEHGPLQRTELGEDKVQGMDYVYTLQGWIKSVNHPYLDHYQTNNYTSSQNDPGRDSILAGQGVAKDVWAFTLGYFDGDYQRNNSVAEAIEYNNVNLYNGNISHWANGANLSNSSFDTEHLTQRDFRYDDLNRLKSSTVQTTSSIQGSIPTLQTGSQWKTNYAYDANGNITQLNRHGADATLIDELSYIYQVDKNRLDTLIDNRGKQLGVDVGNQSYSYDDKGNLIKQVDGDTTLEIDWMNTGKVRYVTQKIGGVVESGLEYQYDAAGNRIVKIHKPVYDSLDTWVYTFYVRDASGNILSIYTRTQELENGLYAVKCNLEEQLLYGSSRIGTKKNDTYVLSSCPYNNGEQVSSHKGWDIKRKFEILGDTLLLCRQLDKKQYELSDHLGNVTMALADRRKGKLADDNLAAKVLSYNQYYPFGWNMPGRSFTNGTESRFSFNGKETDKEWGGSGIQDYGFRLYNPAIAKFLSVDPIGASFPWNSSYAFAENDVIRSIDLEGAERLVVTLRTSGGEIYSTKIQVADQGTAAMGANGNLIIRNSNGFDDITYRVFRDEDGGDIYGNTLPPQDAFRYNNEQWKFNQFTINNDLNLVDVNGIASPHVTYKEQIVQTSTTTTTTKVKGTKLEPRTLTVSPTFTPSTNNFKAGQIDLLDRPLGSVGPVSATIQGTNPLPSSAEIGNETWPVIINDVNLGKSYATTLDNARTTSILNALLGNGITTTNLGTTFGSSDEGLASFSVRFSYKIRVSTITPITTTTTSDPRTLPWGSATLGTTTTKSGKHTTSTRNRKGTNTITPRSVGTSGGTTLDH